MQVHWQQLAEWQAGLVSRRQLNAAGIDRWRVRNQVISGRWMTVGPRVVALFTGDLTWEQRSWAGHLHAGPTSMIAGLASARHHGLKGWERQLIEVVVPFGTTVSDLDGFRFIRSRRDLDQLRGGGIRRHLMQLEPAVLIRAASGMPERVSGGLLASAVQQRLTSADHLLRWLPLLQPLPRTKLFRGVLHDIRAGARTPAVGGATPTRSGTCRMVAPLCSRSTERSTWR